MVTFRIGDATVPDVDNPGTLRLDAITAIEAAGLVAVVQFATSASVPAGQVVSQSPAAGGSVAFDSTVTITVSRGTLLALGRPQIRLGLGL